MLSNIDLNRTKKYLSQVHLNQLLFWAVLAVYVGLNTYIFWLPRNKEHLFIRDYKAFVTAAEIVKRGRVENLYSPYTQSKVQGEMTGVNLTPENFLAFRNPAIVSLIFLPFTYLSLETGFTLYMILSGIFVLSGLLTLRKELELKNKVFFLLLAFIPTVAQIYYGNISSILFWAAVMVWKSLRNRRFVEAGLMSTLFAIKPQFLIIIPLIFFIIRDTRRYITGFMFGLFAFVIANIYLYGGNFLVDYSRFLIYTENFSLGTDFRNNYNLQSLGASGLLDGITRQPLTATFIITIVIYFLVLGFLLFKKQTADVFTKNIDRAVAGILLLGVSLNVHTMYTDLGFLILSLGLLANLYLGTKKLKYLIYSIAIYLTSFASYFYLQWAAAPVLIVLGIIITLRDYE